MVWAVTNKSFYKKSKRMIGHVEIYFHDDLLEKNVAFTKAYEIEKADD